MPMTTSATLAEHRVRLPIATSGQVLSAAPSRRISCSSSTTTKVCVTCCRIRSRFSSLHHNFRRQQSPILTPRAKTPKRPSTRTHSRYTTGRIAFRGPCPSPQLQIQRLDAALFAPEREIPILQELPYDSSERFAWLV